MLTTKQRIIERNKYRPQGNADRPIISGMTVKYPGDKVLTGNTCVVI